MHYYNILVYNSQIDIKTIKNYSFTLQLLSALAREKKNHFDEMMMITVLYYANTLTCISVVLAYCNNSPLIKIPIHPDTLSWFRVIQSQFLLFNTAYLAEKQQLQIFKSLVWPNRDSNPRPTALDGRSARY